jgi:hypothetical protein
MRLLLFAIGVALIGVALWHESDGHAADQAASKLMGAGCGYLEVQSHGDDCDRNEDGTWRCGAHTNLEAYAGDGNLINTWVPCASTGCSDTRELDDCDES